MNALNITGAAPGRLWHICYDSRQARRGSVFVAIRGAQADGHDFIRDAVRRGATTVVAERRPDFRLPRKVTFVLTGDSREALARLSGYLYDDPSRELGLVGITGTNGKTTVSYLVASVARAAGHECGRLGTTDYDLIGERAPAENTTPESLEIQRMLRTMVERGAGYCAMEVSSHALAQKRVEGLSIRAAVFTNLTRDHLDYHHDMEDYFRAKALLFTRLSPAAAVINLDDPYAQRLIPLIEAPVTTYGMDPAADVTAGDVRMDVNGVEMTLQTPAGTARIRSRLVGWHNVSNILAAAGVAAVEGFTLAQIARGIAELISVPGRFEMVPEGQPFAVAVDYAHTDDALANVLRAARPLTRGRLITVFGCGGDRDATKRPLMGRVAWTMSDRIVVTSDNPRTEDPEKIIQAILAGIRPEENPRAEMKVIADRRLAIQAAVAMAKPGDFVLIAGKGHEDYQIIGREKRHFDDREEARRAIRQLHGEFQNK